MCGVEVGRAQEQPWRLSPRGQRWFDVALATCLLLPIPGVLFVEAWWVVLGAAQIVPLYWRRGHPVAVFAVVAAASGAQVLVLDVPLWSQLAFPVATYSVARYATTGWGVAAAAGGIVAAAVASVDWLNHYGEALKPSNFMAYFLTISAFVVTAWALGALGRTRHAYVDALVERGRQIEREASQQVALAASEERTRIAREMHDVVAHGLSVMVVQADGARYAAARRPEVAVEALTTIAATGRQALTEMRRLLGLLRADDTGTRPQPRLPDIAALVAEHQVPAELEGLDRPVPDGVALTAYRVVQEALSNVRKHAGPEARSRVRVTVTDAVEIVVDDDGRGASAIGDGQGLGLLGMRERVLAHDGDIAAAPRPSGGFRVRARIPL